MREWVKRAKHRWIIERDLPRAEARVRTGTLRRSGAGEVFTITPRYASPLRLHSSRKEVVFPPPQAPVDLDYTRHETSYRRCFAPRAAHRVRVERPHNPHSVRDPTEFRCALNILSRNSHSCTVLFTRRRLWIIYNVPVVAKHTLISTENRRGVTPMLPKTHIVQLSFSHIIAKISPRSC